MRKWIGVDVLRSDRYEPASQDHNQPNPVSFERWNDSSWAAMAESQNPTPTTILTILPVNARKIRVRLERGSVSPSIADIGLYNEP